MVKQNLIKENELSPNRHLVLVLTDDDSALQRVTWWSWASKFVTKNFNTIFKKHGFREGCRMAYKVMESFTKVAAAILVQFMKGSDVIGLL